MHARLAWQIAPRQGLQVPASFQEGMRSVGLKGWQLGGGHVQSSCHFCPKNGEGRLIHKVSKSWEAASGRLFVVLA